MVSDEPARDHHHSSEEEEEAPSPGSPTDSRQGDSSCAERKACTPQDQAPPGADTPPEQTPPGPGTSPCGQTHTCKHITLPQTSFAGGNNKNPLPYKRN